MIVTGSSAADFYSNYTVLDGSVATPTIIYHLVSSDSDPGYTLTGGHFWQYSGDNGIDGERNVTSASILVSSDGITYTPAGTLSPHYYRPNSDGVADPGVDFSLTGSFANVRYVELYNIVGNPWNSIQVGFNEIRFTATAVPEPGSLVLLGMGIVSLGMIARRHQSRKS